MTATTLQMTAAYSAMINGGTYYQPTLIDGYLKTDGKFYDYKPKVVRKNVVKPKVSKEVQSIMEYVVDKHRFSRKFSDAYSVGGKTGTAQIANPAGGYLENEYNGTYTGFVGGDDADYVITIKVDRPKIPGY